MCTFEANAEETKYKLVQKLRFNWFNFVFVVSFFFLNIISKFNTANHCRNKLMRRKPITQVLIKSTACIDFFKQRF